MAQSLTLSLGTQLPKTHVVYKGFLEIKRKLEESSKGTMTLKLFPGSQLGDFKAMVGQVQAGDLDMTNTGYPDLSYIIPELKLIGAPYVIKQAIIMPQSLLIPIKSSFWHASKLKIGALPKVPRESTYPLMG